MTKEKPFAFNGFCMAHNSQNPAGWNFLIKPKLMVPTSFTATKQSNSGTKQRVAQRPAGV